MVRDFRHKFCGGGGLCGTHGKPLSFAVLFKVSFRRGGAS